MFGNINPPPSIKPDPLNRSRVKPTEDATKERSKGNQDNPAKRDSKGNDCEDHPNSPDDAFYSTISSATNHPPKAESNSSPSLQKTQPNTKKHLDVTV